MYGDMYSEHLARMRLAGRVSVRAACQTAAALTGCSFGPLGGCTVLAFEAWVGRGVQLARRPALRSHGGLLGQILINAAHRYIGK